MNFQMFKLILEKVDYRKSWEETREQGSNCFLSREEKAGSGD